MSSAESGEVSKRPHVTVFAMRATLIPIGLAFKSGGAGWAVLDFIPADLAPAEMWAGPDDGERG